MKPTDLAQFRANAASMSRRLKAMGNAERLLMICRMDQGEVSVNELVALTGLRQSAVSQHLGILRAEGVVEVRIDANLRWYRLKDPVVSGLVHALCALCVGHGPHSGEADVGAVAVPVRSVP